MVFRNNGAVDCEGDGFFVSAGKHPIEFTGNYSHGNKGDGFRFEGTTAPGSKIVGNSAMNNGGHGFNIIDNYTLMLSVYGLDRVDPAVLAKALSQLVNIDKSDRESKIGEVLSALGAAGERLIVLTSNVLAISADPRVLALIAALSQAS